MLVLGVYKNYLGRDPREVPQFSAYYKSVAQWHTWVNFHSQSYWLSMNEVSNKRSETSSIHTESAESLELDDQGMKSIFEFRQQSSKVSLQKFY